MNDIIAYIVWCDSPQGLISTRVDDKGRPLFYNMSEFHDVHVAWDTEAAFDILGKKDATKVAIPLGLVPDILGWDVVHGNDGD